MADDDKPLPAKPNTDGKNSTEYAVTRQAQLVGIIGMVAGMIVAVGPQLVGLFPQDSHWNQAIGTIVSVASLIYKTLVENKFIGVRGDLKVAQQQSMSPPPTTSTKTDVDISAGGGQ